MKKRRLCVWPKRPRDRCEIQKMGARTRRTYYNNGESKDGEEVPIKKAVKAQHLYTFFKCSKRLYLYGVQSIFYAIYCKIQVID